jgi:hypothetical protein
MQGLLSFVDYLLLQNIEGGIIDGWFRVAANL